MRRRDLLRAALGLGALMSWPGLSFGSGTPREQRAALSKALHLAAEGGKVLLVMVIPHDDGEKWTRGRLLGEWLNAAGDASLAPLVALEVVCATTADLRQLVPAVGSEEPWFFLITAQGAHRSLTPALPEPPGGEPNYGDGDYFGQGHTDWNLARVRANIAAIDAVLLPAVGELAPAIGSQERQAARVRERLVQVAPAGAHWARSGGCGTDIEGVESQYSVDCGMGHVPEGSRRLLYFFDVNEPRF